MSEKASLIIQCLIRLRTSMKVHNENVFLIIRLWNNDKNIMYPQFIFKGGGSNNLDGEAD